MDKIYTTYFTFWSIFFSYVALISSYITRIPKWIISSSMALLTTILVISILTYNIMSEIIDEHDILIHLLPFIIALILFYFSPSSIMNDNDNNRSLIKPILLLIFITIFYLTINDPKNAYDNHIPEYKEISKKNILFLCSVFFLIIFCSCYQIYASK